MTPLPAAAGPTAGTPYTPRMTDYARAVREFRWSPPASFNFGRDVVDAWARADDREALDWSDAAGGASTLRYSDVARRSAQLARLMRRLGLARGDRVLVQLPRIPAWHIAMVACTKVGAVPIPCIEMLTEGDLRYRAEHSGAVMAITTPANAHKYRGCDGVRLRLATAAHPGWVSMDEAAAESDDFATLEMPDTAPEEPAILYYTSGSSGKPKGVTHAARALWAWRYSAACWHDLGPGERIWCTADTGWAKSGTAVLFAPWSQGATVVMHDGPFEPRRRLELLARHRVTVFCAAATEFRHLLGLDLSQLALPALRLAVSAGETVNPEVVRRWQAATGVPLLDGYGQTETLMTVLNYPCMRVEPGSMGRPLPGCEFAVLSADHAQRLPDGQTGQLAMRLPNPQFMLGYWREPERTREAIVRVDGADWWLTGDLGRRDADGYYFYEGRADDVIGSAGYRIGPTEVESALIEHPAVLESAVIGKPDAERGEIVKAFVVLRAGHAGTPALAEALQAHVKRVTAPYKYPREIEFVDHLPKSAAGKLLRRVLRDAERARAAGGAP